jgi:hypothetical protein
MSRIEIYFFTARILQNQRMLCCGECFHDYLLLTNRNLSPITFRLLRWKKYWKFNLHLCQEQLRNVRVSQFSSCFSWDDWFCVAKSENAMLWRMLSRLETCIVYCCIWSVTLAKSIVPWKTWRKLWHSYISSVYINLKIKPNMK